MEFYRGSPFDHKHVPTDASPPLKRPLVVFILGGLGIYILLFGIAFKVRENRMNRLEKRTSAIYAQLAAKNEQGALEIIPRRPAIRHSEGPELFNPSSIFCAFFCAQGADSEAVKTLKAIVVSFKGDLSEVNLAAIDLSGKETDLSDANLSGADLREADFRYANFSRAKLIGTKLNKAKLSKTNFSEADFRRADLWEARLSKANLRGANLSKADLSGADLREAKLVGTDLRKVNFFYADFFGADLTEANLRGVKLSGADFRKANFFNADLSGAVLSGVRLNGANLTGANLNEADLRYANLSNTIGLTQGMLDRVIVDKNTQFPEGLKAPEKPTAKIGVVDFDPFPQ